ncbi:MAG TPA: hypothetical protein VJZ27_08345, partial [Aggregatilineales bacterium]|nr:hypothetical protein [Aggregatilineales bacterium]
KMLLSGTYGSPPDIRQLDLDAELPEIKRAPQIPRTISFEELYFYKNSHPLVRDALAFGILQKRGIPIHSGDSFRKIQAGEKTHLFHDWITSVRFSKKEQGNEPRG